MNCYTFLIFTVIQILIHFLLFSNLFVFALAHKYVLFVGNFNAHHSDWEDQKTDPQGEHISRTCEDHHLVMMNDGSPTFLSPPNFSFSIIDLSIASRPVDAVY